MKQGDTFYYVQDGNWCQYRFLMPSLDCSEKYFLADYGYGGIPVLLNFKDNRIFNSRTMAIEATIKYLSEALEVRKKELESSILTDARIEATIKYLSEALEVRKKELESSILTDARKENNQ